ncbi:restriction endonuclease subunit S [Nocardia abscessus]|uniref:Restriction endonuclease subunit S n=1 Tax=Nocardia abscessus TaxID=120957 RepID=A0ABS0CB64_9NOCA|nr:restriction endonuclease subunit S [Nocardia abscessus]MBF6227075.1 restriction endonuclease subunit S [Nocardia abscessus]
MTTLQFARVGDLSDQIRGVTYSKEEASKVPLSGTKAILRAGNITETGISLTDLVYVPEDKVSARQLLQQGDVVVATSSGSLEVVGKAAQTVSDLDVGFGAFCKVLRPSKYIDARYFGHFFRTSSYRRTISSLAAGANINNLKNAHLDNLVIPLPPIHEQRRIAEVLDRVDALREKRRKSITLLNDLAQSIFLDMFGDPVNNERGWPRVTVSEFVREFQSGKSLAQAPDDSESDIRILKISAVTSGTFSEAESKPAPNGYNPPASHFVKNGDLLFSRANTSELIGATAIVDTDPKNLLLPDKLWRFRWKDETSIDPQFVHFLFRHPSFREQIARASTGSSGSMKNISQAKVMGLHTALPPAELQFLFGSRVSACRQQRSDAVRHLRDLDTLFASIQSRAFRGELWQDDVKDS